MAATAVGLVEREPDPVRTYRLPPNVRRRRAAYERDRQARLRAIGPLEVDAGPTRALIGKLRKEGWTQAQLTRATGLSRSFFCKLPGQDTIFRVSADRVERLWEKMHPPEVSLSPEPLVAYIEARFGSLNAAGKTAEVCHLRADYRNGKGLTRRQADQWARKYGKLEWEIWPELHP